MSPSRATVSPSAPLSVATDRLVVEDVDDLLVTSDEEAVGVLADRDVLATSGSSPPSFPQRYRTGRRPEHL